MCESALRCPSLVQSPLSVQHSKTVPWPKQSTHSLHILFLFFLWDLVFVTQSKTKEEICWVELTPLWVIGSLSSISCTKSTFCSAHKDSPLAKTITHSLHILFLFFCGTQSLQHRLRLRKRLVGWNWLLCWWSALRHPSLVQSPLSVLST